MVIDDQSKDNTVDIATQYGWKVIKNEGKGIGDGANTALKNVQISLQPPQLTQLSQPTSQSLPMQFQQPLALQ
jgi:hypothetical protein